jgi:ribonuclease HII
MVSTDMPDFSFEQDAPTPVAGIDEAGRGPWAGPVVAAAVILDPANFPAGLNDSKKLSARKRESLFEELQNCAQIGVGMASVEEIDSLNILQATFLAMQRAVDDLPVKPAYLLIDGNQKPPINLPLKTVTKGDGRSFSIAAASIIAKNHRDSLMRELAQTYPDYGWEKNAGYGTAQHRDALNLVGVTPHHRRSFAPIRKILTQDSYINY